MKKALLHKPEASRDKPSPRRSYATAGTGTVAGRPSCVKRLSKATRTCSSVTWRSNVRAITRSPKRLKQCILVSTRLTAPLLPDTAPQPLASSQGFVAPARSLQRLSPRPCILARGNHRLRTSLRYRRVAPLCVVGSIPTDTCHRLIERYLGQQFGQHGGIAHAVVCDFKSPACGHQCPGAPCAIAADIRLRASCVSIPLHPGT